MSKLRFMDACMDGDALLDEIDDYIDEWHESDSEEEIYEFLGMTKEEYGVWVENDSMLKSIFHSREIGMSINDFISGTNGQKLVARASSPEEASLVKDWLERTGRLK